MSDRAKSARFPVWLRETFIIAAIAIGVLFVVGVLRREAQKGGGGDLEVGSEAPTFALRHAVDGKVWRLSDLKGRPVVLNFWATWCGVCQSDMPDLDRFASEANGRYHVLAISAESPDLLARYATRRGFVLPVLSDPSGRTLANYHVNAFPTVVIIDADGRIVHDFEGSAHLDVLADHMRALGAGR
jgi:peroxiredoxin